MSAATATKYVQEMVKLETISAGTKEAALHKLERDYGLTVSQLTHFYKARAKTCDIGLFSRVKAAYIDRCARMATRVLHNIQLAEASGTDADDQDLVDRLTSILAEVEAQKSKLHH